MYDISQLNDMLVPELQDIAEQLSIPQAKRLEKQDMIYKILDRQAVVASESKEPAAEKGRRRRIVKTNTSNSTEEAEVMSGTMEQENGAASDGNTTQASQPEPAPAAPGAKRGRKPKNKEVESPENNGVNTNTPSEVNGTDVNVNAIRLMQRVLMRRQSYRMAHRLYQKSSSAFPNSNSINQDGSKLSILSLMV
jgi:transcription termination factor Rho